MYYFFCCLSRPISLSGISVLPSHSKNEVLGHIHSLGIPHLWKWSPLDLPQLRQIILPSSKMGLILIALPHNDDVFGLLDDLDASSRHCSQGSLDGLFGNASASRQVDDHIKTCSLELQSRGLHAVVGGKTAHQD